MAVKKGLQLIKLKSTASSYFYIKIKNPKKLQKKLSFFKYDPIVRKHVEFKEAKA